MEDVGVFLSEDEIWTDIGWSLTLYIETLDITIPLADTRVVDIPNDLKDVFTPINDDTLPEKENDILMRYAKKLITKIKNRHNYLCQQADTMLPITDTKGFERKEEYKIRLEAEKERTQKSIMGLLQKLSNVPYNIGDYNTWLNREITIKRKFEILSAEVKEYDKATDRITGDFTR